MSYRVSLEAQLVKDPPAMQETRVQPLGWEDPLEKGTATYSSILASMECIVHGFSKSQTRLRDQSTIMLAGCFFFFNLYNLKNSTWLHGCT